MIDNYKAIIPIFIGGCPRSGTTMLGSILGSAENCVVTPESHFKQSIPIRLGVDWEKGLERESFIQKLEKNFRFKIWEIPIPELDLPEQLTYGDYRMLLLTLVKQYSILNGFNGWTYWIDHTPQNIQNVLMLLKIFPDAKFIHIVRDPRAVAASVLPLDWGPNEAEEAAIFWAQKLSYGLVLEQYYPQICLRVYYEDILNNPSDTIKKICSYCNINFKEDILSGDNIVLPEYTKRQHSLVGNFPNISKLNSWQNKLKRWQIFKIEEKLGDLMELMGYQKEITTLPPQKTTTDKLLTLIHPLIISIKKNRYKLKKKKYGISK